VTPGSEERPQAQAGTIDIHELLRAHPLFRQMIARQGIDLTEAAWRAFDGMIAQAIRRCGACPEPAKCVTWLDEEHPRESSPVFCPNSAMIAASRIVDPKAAPGTGDEVEIAGRVEPLLEQLLADPMIRQLMDADRIPTELLRGKRRERD
jgi:hypothetical protein